MKAKTGSALALVGPLFIANLAASPVSAADVATENYADLALSEIIDRNLSSEEEKDGLPATSNGASMHFLPEKEPLTDVSGIARTHEISDEPLLRSSYPNYEFELGVELLLKDDADLKKGGASYLKQASDAGFAPASNALGFLFQKGIAVPQDLRRAARLYAQAVLQENPLAQNNLGYLYFMGAGTRQDVKKAAGLFMLAAQQDEPHAQCNLAWLYQNGIGVEQDLQKAATLYKKAAARGLAPAIYNLGYLYQNGLGVRADSEKANELYKMARLGELDVDNTLCALSSAVDDGINQQQRPLKLMPATAANPPIAAVKKFVSTRLSGKSSI